MMIDLVMAEPDFPPSSIRLKADWTLVHSAQDQRYMGAYKVLQNEVDHSIRLAVEFQQDDRSNCVCASISIDRVTQQGAFMNSDELFCFPIPVETAAAMCFTRRDPE